MSTPAKPPSAGVLAVWEAEDGRCETCRRPMDRSLARTGRDKRGSRCLLCPDCKDHQPEPLAAAVVGPKTAGHLAEALGTTLEAAGMWLAERLRAAGVLLRLQDDGRRMYWLPGVGNFSLVDGGPNHPPLMGGPLHRELEIRSKPQARTRGLPRLRAPSYGAEVATRQA